MKWIVGFTIILVFSIVAINVSRFNLGNYWGKLSSEFLGGFFGGIIAGIRGESPEKNRARLSWNEDDAHDKGCTPDGKHRFHTR